MKRLYGSAACALCAAAVLTLPACSSPGHVSSGDTVSTGSLYSAGSYYQLRGRYYHCHPGGECHSVRHGNYYWDGDSYRPRPGYQHLRSNQVNTRPLSGRQPR